MSDSRKLAVGWFDNESFIGACEQGVELDAIFNANCYGDIANSETLADHVTGMLKEMDSNGLFPEHLTTTSPFIATVVRQRFPGLKVRFSINMDIASRKDPAEEGSFGGTGVRTLQAYHAMRRMT